VIEPALGSAIVPDAKTIWLFWEHLTQAVSIAVLFI